MRARTKNPSSWGTALEPVSQGPAARGPQPSYGSIAAIKDLNGTWASGPPGAALGDSSFAGSQQGMATNVGASLGFHGCEGPQPSRSGTTMKSFDLDLESICSRVKKDRKKWDGSEAIHP